MAKQSRSRSVLSQLKSQVGVLGGCVLIVWGVEAVDQFLISPPGGLDRYGIRPRQLDGLWGILFSPFLHANFAHLAANTIPFLVLGWLVMLSGEFAAVSIISMILGGLGVWAIGNPGTVHIGASGVIFGYLGYLLLRGVFERRLGSVLVAVVVGVLFGGLIWGVLPGQPGVSWQGHLCGFFAGVIAAGMVKKKP